MDQPDTVSDEDAHIGVAYMLCEDVPQVDAKVVQWVHNAAEQGYAPAQYLFGLAYEVGGVVPRDYAEAVKWWRLAAEQGDADAQSNLGLMYGLGRGVPRDYVRAHMWLTLAMSRVHNEDGANFARTRRSVAKKMNGEQIAEARRLAHAWKPKTWDELQEGGGSSDAV